MIGHSIGWWCRFWVLCCVLYPMAGELAHAASEEPPAIPLYKEPLWTQEGADKPITLLAFSSDGRTLASAKSDGTVELWNAATGKKLQIFDTGWGRFFQEMAFSKDGKLLTILFGDGKLMLWSVVAKKKLSADFGDRQIDAFAIAPDGKTLALGTESGEILLWDLTRQRVRHILQKKSHAIHNLAFSHDGKRLASCERLGTCLVWDLDKKTSTPYSRLDGAASTLHFTSKGEVLATTPVRLVRLFSGNREKEAVSRANWTLRYGQGTLSYRNETMGTSPWETFEVEPERSKKSPFDLTGILFLEDVALHRLFARLAIGSRAPAVAFSPNELSLAVGTKDGGLQMWEVPPDLSLDLTPLAANRNNLGPRIDPVRAVAFSPDGRTLASAVRSVVWLWNPATGLEKDCLKQPTGEVWALAFAPDGKLLASGGTDRQVRLRDAVSGKEWGTLDKQKGVVLCLAFRPDGKLLVSGDASGAAHVWEMATRKQRWLLKGHQGDVCAVFFAADGRTLLSCDTAGFVRFWDLASGKETRKLSLKGPIEAGALSPDRKTLAAATPEGALSFWDLASGRPLPLSAQIGAYPRGLAFAPDGRTFASASIASGMKLWTLRGGTIAPYSVGLGSATRSVRCVTFAPDGHTLATGGAPELLHVWSLRPAP